MTLEASDRIFTIPNLLSVLRLLLIPVFFALLVVYENNILAFVVLLLASLSDLVDGFIARATNSVTRLGQLLDPFVDRIFILVGIVAIFVIGRVPLWILVVLVARDACMLALTVYQKKQFNRDFRVIFLGKLTTALLMAGFCSLLLNWPMLSGAQVAELSFLPGLGSAETALGSWLLYVGVLFSLISGAVYVYKGTRFSQNEKNDGLAQVIIAQKGEKEKPQRLTPRDSFDSPAGFLQKKGTRTKSSGEARGIKGDKLL